MDISMDQKTVVVFLGAFIFGLYCSTFMVGLRWLLFTEEGWRIRKNIRWPIVTVTLLIFASNGVHISWTLYWTMVAVRHAIGDPPGSLKYETPEYATLVSCTVSSLVFVLADAVLIVRCWIIYGRRNFLVITPAVLLWIAALVCMVLQIYLEVAHIHNPNFGPYSWAKVNMIKGPGVVLVPFWIATNLLNAYLIGALIHRIYRVAKECAPYMSTKHLRFAIRLIAESGALYFPITVAHLILWFWTSNFALVIADTLNAPMLGIAFNWLIIRAARNETAGATKDICDDNIRFGKSFLQRESFVNDATFASNSTSVGATINIVNWADAASTPRAFGERGEGDANQVEEVGGWRGVPS